MKRKGTRIYAKAIEIRAEKGEDSLYPGERFRHKFGPNDEIIGNKDGSITIRNTKGKRLWRRFEQ